MLPVNIDSHIWPLIEEIEKGQRRFIFCKFDQTTTKIIPDSSVVGPTSPYNGRSVTCADIREILPAREPRFILYDVESVAVEGEYQGLRIATLDALLWIPQRSRVRDKMIYASAMQNFVTAIGRDRLGVTHQCSTPDDVDDAQLVSRHQIHQPGRVRLVSEFSGSDLLADFEADDDCFVWASDVDVTNPEPTATQVSRFDCLLENREWVCDAVLSFQFLESSSDSSMRVLVPFPYLFSDVRASSPFAETKSVVVTLQEPFGQTFDEELFLKILLGCPVQIPTRSGDSSLVNLFRVFEAMDQVDRAFVLCLLIKKIRSLKSLVSLAEEALNYNAGSGSCPGCVRRIHSPKGDSIPTEWSGLSFCILLSIVVRRASFPETERPRFDAAVERFSEDVKDALVIFHRQGLGKYKFTDHPFFSDWHSSKTPRDSFQEVSREMTRQLLLVQSSFDVEVAVEGEESSLNAHLSVLLWNSSFFTGLFHFQGKEREELLERRRVVVQLLEFDVLQVLVEWLYTGEFLVAGDHETVLRLLLSCWIHGRMFVDLPLIKCSEKEIKTVSLSLRRNLKLRQAILGSCFDLFESDELVELAKAAWPTTWGMLKNLNTLIERAKRKSETAVALDECQDLLAEMSAFAEGVESEALRERLSGWASQLGERLRFIGEVVTPVFEE